MPLSTTSVQAWYTQRLHDFYFDGYLAYRGYTAAGEPRTDPAEDVYPSPVELSAEARQIEPDSAPTDVRETFDFYHKHFAEADIGSAHLRRSSKRGKHLRRPHDHRRR